MENIGFRLTNTERVLLVLISIALVFCFYSIWYSKKNQQVKNIKSKIEQTKVSINAKKIIFDKLNSEKNQSKEIKYTSYENKINYVIKSKTSFSDYINNLDSKSKKEGIVINRVSTESDEYETPFRKRLFKIEIESSFVNIGKFIEELDRSQYLTQIKSVDVKRLSDDLKVCRAEINVFAYQLEQRGNNVAAK